ncbi:hypothetical protein CEXT_408601 [Caerostris extrusa]|uniref:Uncharacterized protein n=1 Tax=Caerostris extrusa TaxID=172846 RepID=A0AAV4MHF2_CAEEX|nr:hypothetical protein CEXT_408601 [Caerostris extrusa]
MRCMGEDSGKLNKTGIKKMRNSLPDGVGAFLESGGALRVLADSKSQDRTEQEEKFRKSSVWIWKRN